jgi:hypothetical protein
MPLRAVLLALGGPPLPPIRLHDLRHGAASLTYRATRDLKLVSELLGHSGIQVTADTYTTLFQEVDVAAAEAVARLVPRRYHHVRTMCTPQDPSRTALRTAANPPNTSEAERTAACPDGLNATRARAPAHTIRGHGRRFACVRQRREAEVPAASMRGGVQLDHAATCR